MKRLKTIIRLAQNLSLGLGLVFATGCTSLVVTKTVGFPGLPPLANANDVNLVDAGTPINQPYQVVGAVTVFRRSFANTQQPLDNGYCSWRIRELAADMGADGVIGVHQNWGVDTKFKTPIPVVSGLTVKWLAPGEVKRPLTKPFVVAVLPMAEDAEEVPGGQTVTRSGAGKNRTETTTQAKPVKNNHKELTEAVDKAVVCPLETKGYYVLPSDNITFKGGLEGARDLSDTELKSLGGDDASLLLEVDVLTKAHGTIILQSSSSVTAKSTLMDKATRKQVYQDNGIGTITLGWIVNMMVDKEIAATAGAAAGSLINIPSIGDVVQSK